MTGNSGDQAVIDTIKAEGRTNRLRALQSQGRGGSPQVDCLIDRKIVQQAEHHPGCQGVAGTCAIHHLNRDGRDVAADLRGSITHPQLSQGDNGNLHPHRYQLLGSRNTLAASIA